ncbi:MAG: NAD(P)-dependent glycerol-3-phosphate dehydrogenase [Xanthobacteraceae bacterium]|nr:NAD(P)-dependent glycerol-3-phosphate dehydrogenase [Xanthobacteraceae bacterium]
MNRIGVIGAGAWGTALANAAAKAGRGVVLHGRDASLIGAIEKVRSNEKYLPGIKLDSKVMPTTDLARVVEADAILLVTPTQSLRETATLLAPLLRAGTPVIACSKGIEIGSKKFVTEVIEEVLPQARAAILSGPGFAEDVAAGLPTAITLAANEETLALELANALSSQTFRLYHSTDVRGVEIGGAAKNVLAIAAGIVAGRKLGASAQAALTTRGFSELMRFARAYDAKAETLTGLSGLGDLILTCSSAQSRNYAFGVSLGGSTSVDVRGKKLTEGVYTAPVLVESARAKNVEMPIAEAVAAVLAGKVGIDAAIAGLLSRPLRQED